MRSTMMDVPPPASSVLCRAARYHGATATKIRELYAGSPPNEAA
jgi:hypothetical protein